MGLLDKALERLRGPVTQADEERWLRSSVTSWARPSRYRRGVSAEQLGDLGTLVGLLEDRGEYEEAKRLLEAGLAVSFVTMRATKLTAFVGRRALLMAKLGDVEGAHRVLAEQRARIDAADGDLTKTEDAFAFARGQVLRYTGDFVGAIAAYQRHDTAPRDGGEPYRGVAEPEKLGVAGSLFLVPHLLIVLERFDDAERQLEAIGALRPDDPWLMVFRGTLARERGALDEAGAHYDRAQAQFTEASQPSTPTLEHARARLALASRDWPTAMEHAKRAIRTYEAEDGDRAEPLVAILADLARANHGRGRLGGARDAGRRSLRLAKYWRSGALIAADAEAAFGQVCFDEEPEAARTALQSADTRLSESLPPSNRRRVEITRLLARR